MNVTSAWIPAPSSKNLSGSILALRKAFFVLAAVLSSITVAPFDAMAQNPPPQSILNIATTLTRMGRQDVAADLIRDFGAGRVRIGQIGANAETGVPSAFGHYTGWGSNIMTLNERYIDPFGSKAAGRVNAVNSTSINAALTVIHEYVHLTQTSPEQTPQFEDSAWRATIEENQRWMRHIMNEITDTELHTPNSAGKTARIRELTGTLDGLARIHDTTINDLKDEMRANHVSAGLTLPTLNGADVTSPDQARAKVTAFVETFNRNTRDGIARAEKEMRDTTAPSNTEPKATNDSNKVLTDKTNSQKAEKSAKAEQERAERDRALNANAAAKMAHYKELEAKAIRLKAEAAKSQAEADRLRAIADRSAAEAAETPALPPGTHEEVSGWAKDKKGSTKLTYVKDAAGNVIGGSYTHYDANNRQTGREDFKTSARSTSARSKPVPSAPSVPAPASKPGLAKIVGGVNTKVAQDLEQRKRQQPTAAQAEPCRRPGPYEPAQIPKPGCESLPSSSKPRVRGPGLNPNGD